MSPGASRRDQGLEQIMACPLCRRQRLRVHAAAPTSSAHLHTQQCRCTDCGLLVSSPRVTDEARDRYYQERYYEEQWPDADRVLRENLGTHALCDFALLERLAGAELRRGGRALDVGSGYGATVETLRRRGFRAAGCELSWRGCTFARAQGLAVVCGKTPSLPFVNGAFDLVTSAHVIEHVGDPHAFVRELVRLLSPGGVLAIVTDHVAASQHAFNRLCARATFRMPPFQTSTDHTFVFGTGHLRTLLEDAGCTKVDIAVYHHAPPPESWHWRAYKSTFRFLDRLLGWGPYQLAMGIRAA